jgi:hypothetical protein
MRVRTTMTLWAAGFGLLACGCSASNENAEYRQMPDAGDTPEAGQALPGCGLHTGFDGDEYCIAPPPEAEGFQLHYGPSNYQDQSEVAKYLITPGIDTNVYVPVTSGNKGDVYFYKRQYRMRRGSHHLIVSGGGAGSFFGTGRRLGGSQNVVKDNPAGEVPRENVGIGMPLTASSSLILNLHHFNPNKDKTLLKEAWVNFWYVDPSTVTQEAKEIFLWAQGAPIEPGGHLTVHGKKTIGQAGRVLTLYGHRHSNNVRFSAYRTRNGNRELILDDYDWLEPAVFEFNSLAVNPEPNPSARVAGGHTGILDLQVGDLLEWECDIENKRAEAITFGENEAATSEMCILVGDAIGPALMGLSEG